MSAYATSSPSIEQTRWYLIRPPSLAWTWRNETSWDSVAAYSFTGTLTSPNDTAPFQIARMDNLLEVLVPSVTHVNARSHRSGRMSAMRPMLATPTRQVPAGEGWAHEVKWDGVRALTEVHDGVLRMTSRNENVITVAWPELSTSPYGERDLVVDGEVIALNDRGIPDFRTLQERMHVRRASTAERLSVKVPAIYMVFDLLRLDGRDLARLPLEERRRRLEDLALDGTWQVPPQYDDGAMLFEATLQQGLEGVVSKRRDSTYRFGERSPHWLKLAHRHRVSYVVGGWRPQEGTTDRLASVLVGEPPPADCSTVAGWAAASGRSRVGHSASWSPGWAVPTAPSPTRCRPSTPAGRTGSSRCWSWTSTPTAAGTSGCASRPSRASDPT